MGTLDQIRQLRKEGLKDYEITNKLQAEGASPSSVNDAFNQLKIKNAVSEEGNLQVPTPSETENNPMTNEQFYTPKTQDIEETPEFNAGEGENEENYYYPQPQENNSQQNYSEPPQGYQQYGYDQQYSSGNSTDTMIEVAEQVFLEKTKNMQKQLDFLKEFANLAESKIENNHERIKRIEKIIDNLQIKILEKIGNYGESIGGIKREMEMMQDSFSKTLPKFAEMAEKHSEHHTKHKK